MESSDLAQLAIVVSSCDKYAVCWDPFAHGLKKYWPDHPSLYVITNYLAPSYGSAIQVGQDRGWAANLIYALDQIDAQYILYAQEDYWLTHPVDSRMIGEYLSLLEHGQVGSLRLYPVPPPSGDVFPGDPRLSIVPKGTEYRASLQMAIWNTSLLRKLLLVDESPWNFEVYGSRRSDTLNDVFVSVRSKEDGIRYTFTAVVSGMWAPVAFQYAREENIAVAFDRLPKKSFSARQSLLLRRFLYRIKRKLIKFGRSLPVPWFG